MSDFYLVFLAIVQSTAWPQDAAVSGPFKTEAACRQELGKLKKQAMTPPGYTLEMSCINKQQADAKVSLYNCRLTQRDGHNYAYLCRDPRSFR